MVGEMTVRDFFTLQRGNTYNGNLVGKPGPALLGLGSSIQPGGGFREADYKTYGGDCPPHLMLCPGDLFASLKGATKDGGMIGSVARVPKSVPTGRLTQDTVGLKFLTPDPKIVSFLYWVLRTPQYRAYCAGRATGSAVVAMSRDDFLDFPIPERTTARVRLVDLFDAIEDKIELNRRRNQTLEAMARATFQSWFVDFDPVREKAAGREPAGMSKEIAALFPDSFEESVLDPIPTGWTRSKIGSFAINHDSRRVPVKETDRKPGPYPYYGASGIVDHIDSYLFDGEYLLVAEDGENLRTRNTPIAFRATGQFWVNNHAHVVTGPTVGGTRFLMLSLERSDISGYLSGSTIPKLNQKSMNQIEFELPSDAVLDEFERLTDPLFAKIDNNHRSTATLAALRDALLPKLISGELRVPDAERIVGRAV